MCDDVASLMQSKSKHFLTACLAAATAAAARSILYRFMPTAESPQLSHRSSAFRSPKTLDVIKLSCSLGDFSLAHSSHTTSFTYCLIVISTAMNNISEINAIIIRASRHSDSRPLLLLKQL